jgi:hypothetical protein
MREDRLRHGEQGGAVASRKVTLEEILDGSPVPLGGIKGYRRFASRTVLPLGSIDHEYQLSLTDFGQTLLFSPRDGLAKGKSARCPPAGHPFGHIPQ